MSARRFLAPLALLIAVLAHGFSAPLSAQDSNGADLLAQAQRAATEHEFSGVVVVEWRGDHGLHRQRVPVDQRQGTFRLGQLLSSGARRLLRSRGDWQLEWSGDRTSNAGTSPTPSRKYALRVRDGPVLVGRSTRLVTARDDGRLRERFAIDAETGLILRREQFDDRERRMRSVTFVSITFPLETTVAPPFTAPPPTRGSAPKPVASVPSPYRAPGNAKDGFELTGRYRRADGSVQLFYSDGLYAASVFEQLGVLDESALPPGGAWTRLDGRDARAYETSGGTIAVWEADDVVYTCVTDAPRSGLVAIVGAFPESVPDGLAHRVGDFVFGPFRWG